VLAREQRWEEIPNRIDDDVMHTFAVVGTHDEIADKIIDRYDGVLDQVGFSIAVKNDTDIETLGTMVKRIQAGNPT
jgi:alkanesulfonate monooxygenase SsuD/methylene tetrahydromethanopterin reductase-like flavin-dependent oxidoreductase (luciferase family)